MYLQRDQPHKDDIFFKMRLRSEPGKVRELKKKYIVFRINEIN